jgi:hypothetical protein
VAGLFLCCAEEAEVPVSERFEDGNTIHVLAARSVIAELEKDLTPANKKLIVSARGRETERDREREREREKERERERKREKERFSWWAQRES